jgi:hypothetical protein
MASTWNFAASSPSLSDQAAAPAIFTATLGAVRCAVRSVTSIIISVRVACAGNPVMFLANTPIGFYRFQRSWMVFGGLRPGNESFHLNPLRCVNAIPLNTRCSSVRPLPCGFLQIGPIRFNFAPDNQNRPLLIPPKSGV